MKTVRYMSHSLIHIACTTLLYRKSEAYERKLCLMILVALKAIETGVDGIVVSNHGARQLDYSPATITVLEEVHPSKNAI